MAFMTPIMKSGWNLYNVHPPARVVRSKSAGARKRTKSDPHPVATKSNSLPARRSSLKESTSGTSPSASPQPATDRKRPLSQDSLKLRDLDTAMSVIPEAEDESDDNVAYRWEQDSCCSSSDGSSVSAGSNPALSHTTAHTCGSSHLTPRQRFLRRLRKFLGLSAHSPKNAQHANTVSSHPSGSARFHRQRS